MKKSGNAISTERDGTTRQGSIRSQLRIVCHVFSISETCYRYEAKLSDENAQIADWLLRLSVTYKRWGFGLCFLYLRNEGG